MYLQRGSESVMLSNGKEWRRFTRFIFGQYDVFTDKSWGRASTRPCFYIFKNKCFDHCRVAGDTGNLFYMTHERFINIVLSVCHEFCFNTNPLTYPVYLRIHIIVNPSLMYIVSPTNVHTLVLGIVLSILLFLVNSFSQICQGSFCENHWPGGEPTKVKCNYIYPNVITFGPMYLHLQDCDPLSPKGANVITLKCNPIWPMILTKCSYFCQISNHVT